MCREYVNTEHYEDFEWFEKINATLVASVENIFSEIASNYQFNSIEIEERIKELDGKHELYQELASELLMDWKKQIHFPL